MTTDPESANARLLAYEERLPIIQEKLQEAAKELRDDRGERRQFEKLVRTALGVGAVLLASVTVIGVGSAFMVWDIIDNRSASRDNQEAILEQTAQVKHLAELIVDCTDPDGSCAKRAAEQAGSNKADIVARSADAFVSIAACTFKPENEFRACTDQALALIERPLTPDD